MYMYKLQLEVARFAWPHYVLQIKWIAKYFLHSPTIDLN